MAGIERKSISFDEGEYQAVEALLEDKGAREALDGRVVRLRHHVACRGSLFEVTGIDGSSFSDTVRALVRIGLDTVDREYMARQYAAAAPEIASVLGDPGVAGLLSAGGQVLAVDVGEVGRSDDRSRQPALVAELSVEPASRPARAR